MTTSALAATLIHVDARPVAWLIGGRLWPYVAGGADGDDGDGAAGGDAGAGDGAAGSDAGDQATDKAAEGKGDGEKTVTMTQAEFDALRDKLVAKQVQKKEAELAEKAKRDKLDETERLKAEKADAETKATEATSKANARLVAADVKVAAVEAGVKSDRVAAFLRIADTSEIAVDDDGEVDAKAVAKAVAATLKEFPEFKGTGSNGAGRGGGNHNGDAPPATPTSLEEAVSAAYA